MARRPVQNRPGPTGTSSDDSGVRETPGASTGRPGASVVDLVFGSGGELSKRFAGYEPRPGQVEMARAVEFALERGEVLLVEAPTGVGKSLGYLVPAIASKKRTIVVTANIALQEQLVRKDLPTLTEIMPEEFRFALAKGVSNYACLVAVEQAERDGVRAKLPVVDRGQWDEVLGWLSETKSGDLSELDFEPSPTVRQWSTTTSDDCPGSKCRKSSACYSMIARAAWQTADVVVTNYHLFFIDLALRSKGAPGVLPDHDAVIFDEAHKAADIARDFFGFRITERAIANLARMLDGDPLGDKLAKSAARLFSQLRAHRDSDDYKARIKVPDVVPELEAIAPTLGEVAARLDRMAREETGNEQKHRLRQRAQRARDLAAQLDQTRRLVAGSVYFLGGDRDRATLESKLIDVSGVLSEELFSKERPVVLASATLAAAGSDFSLVKRELGVSRCRELTVDSPFDFSKATIVVPKMPDPRERDYAQAVAGAVARSVLAAGGRTLALFTSWRVLNATHERLSRMSLPFSVMKQGDAPRTELVRRFREDVSSVLLGTESFWAGVDVPGEALSCVVIDRLPFTSPEDPVLDAICEADPKGWFHRYSLPRAILQFKQGFGRLIRSSEDRGVVVVLDNRLDTKPYGSQFYGALPDGVGYSDEFEAISETLR